MKNLFDESLIIACSCSDLLSKVYTKVVIFFLEKLAVLSFCYLPLCPFCYSLWLYSTIAALWYARIWYSPFCVMTNTASQRTMHTVKTKVFSYTLYRVLCYTTPLRVLLHTHRVFLSKVVKTHNQM